MNNWHSGTLVQYLYRIRKPWDLHISTYPHLHFEISECLSKQHTQEFQSHKYDKSFQIKLTFRYPIGCCLHIYRIEYCYGGCYCSETTVKIRHGITEWFKICKGVWQGCMLLPCYLASIQSTSCRISGRMNHKLQSSLLWEISTISYMLAQMANNPQAMWETGVWFLGWEDAIKEGMATHSSILAWRIPMDRGAWGAWVHGVARSWTWLSV